MSLYHSKVALLNAAGAHVRYVPAAMAESLVARGTASLPREQRGRVREVHLVGSGAQVIGPATGNALTGTRFTRKEFLDCGAVIVQHHPRSTDYGDREQRSLDEQQQGDA